MTEPTVQVPRWFLEDLAAGRTSGRDEARTLLSQPTPAAEPNRLEDVLQRNWDRKYGASEPPRLVTDEDVTPPKEAETPETPPCGEAFVGFKGGEGSCEHALGHPGRHWSFRWGWWTV